MRRKSIPNPNPIAAGDPSVRPPNESIETDHRPRITGHSGHKPAPPPAGCPVPANSSQIFEPKPQSLYPIPIANGDPPRSPSVPLRVISSRVPLSDFPDLRVSA